MDRSFSIFLGMKGPTPIKFMVDVCTRVVRMFLFYLQYINVPMKKYDFLGDGVERFSKSPSQHTTLHPHTHTHTHTQPPPAPTPPAPTLPAPTLPARFYIAHAGRSEEVVTHDRDGRREDGSKQRLLH